MAVKPIGVAFVGTGDTTEANVKALLDDWMPEKDADGDDLAYNPPVIPNPVSRAHKGLGLCLDWCTGAFGKDDIERQPLSNVVLALTSARDDPDDPADVFLVYVPGGEDDPHLEVVKEAIEAGIRVLDITAGLDDYQLPEPPAETTTRRTRGKAREDTEQIAGQATLDDAVDDTPPWDDGPEGDSKASAEPNDSSHTTEAERPTASSSAPSSGVLSDAAIEAIAVAVKLVIIDIAAAVKTSVVDELPASARPKTKTYPCYVDPDGNYRPVKGRGRPRAGEKHVELTAEEIDAAKAAGSYTE